MTQLEQELSALFADAASRIEVRPVPTRSPRREYFSKALAAAVVAAVVAGIVVVATRVGSDGANRGGAVVPASTQRLIDAVARTLGQPIRLASTFSPNVGTAGRSVTELDINDNELLTLQDGEPQLLIHGNQVFEAISTVERQGLGLPASAQWVKIADSPRTARRMMQGAGGILDVGQLATAISAGRVEVSQVGPDTFRLSAGATPGSAGGQDDGVETVHLSRDGLLSWAKVEMSAPSGPVSHVTVMIRVSALGRPVHADVPDPRTVISQSELQSASGSGQNCVSNPSPAPSNNQSGSEAYSSEMRCSFSLSATTTRPTHARPGR